MTRQAISPRLAISSLSNIRAFPRRRAPFEKGFEALAAFGRGAQLGYPLGRLARQVVVERAALAKKRPGTWSRPARRARNATTPRRFFAQGRRFIFARRLMDETDLARGPRGNNFGGQGIAPRLTRADRPDDERSDHGGNDPSFASLRQKLARSVAIAMSQQAARPTPPP